MKPFTDIYSEAVYIEIVYSEVVVYHTGRDVTR